MQAARSMIAACILMGCSPRTGPVPPLDKVGVVGPETANPEQLCDEHEVRAWSILTDDREVATTRGRCLGKETRGYHFVSQLRENAADQPAYELHFWLGRDGKPRHAQLRLSDRVIHFRWDKRAFFVTLHGDMDTHTPPDGMESTALWVIPEHAVYVREIMIRLGVGAEEGSLSQLAYVPSRSALVPLVVELSKVDGDIIARADRGRFTLRSVGPSSWSRLRIVGVHGEDGRAIYAEQPKAPLWEPSLPEIPKPTYRLAEDLTARPVRVPGDTERPELAGELVFRRDAPPTRNPGVVFLSGSGPQDRHGLVPGTSIDVGSHEIHDALARAGFVVLRLDDRAVGDSETGPLDIGYRAFVDDGRRALTFLASQPEVDPSRIIVLGHSEGALTASILGRDKIAVKRRKHRLAGVIMMAAAGRNFRDLIYSQIRDSMKGRSEEEIEDEIRRARDIHDAVMKGGDVPENIAPLRNWMAEVFAEDPVENLRKVAVPVLLLQGSKDFQVDASLDFEPLRAVVATKPASEAILIEGLDHLFKPETGESKVGHYGDLSRRVDARAIATIVEFARARVGLSR